MAGAASPQAHKTTRRAQCGMDTTGLRRRLRRAGGFRGRPGRKGAAQLRRAARVTRRHGLQRAAASPARCSRRTPARSPAGGGVTGAQLASRRGIVSMLARIALRRRARGAALANHARSRDPRYCGHSIISSWESMSKGVALGCFSGDSGLFHVEHQPRCTTAGPADPPAAAGASRRWLLANNRAGQVDPPGSAGASGALLRTPWAVRPLAACKVRALPSHGQAGNSGRGAGGAAARRGRIWGACRRGRALQKM